MTERAPAQNTPLRIQVKARRKALLELIFVRKHVPGRELAAVLKAPARQVRYDLDALEAKGLIRRNGRGLRAWRSLTALGEKQIE
jgi:DeoR/GlpR family transcriptional regulator of sugar metabolism